MSTEESESRTESKCGASTSEESESKCGGSTAADGGTATADTSTESDTSSKCGASADSSSSRSSGCGAKSDSENTEEKEVGSTVEDFDAEPGQLIAVGLGPGQPEGMTQRAKAALLDAEHIVGYTTYVDLLPDEITDDAEDIYDTPMCGEVSRTEEAIDRALAGNDVAI
ncbi:MAG: SAM-dependent methyltransferase, partial [Haloarculaceae archaeon]